MQPLSSRLPTSAQIDHPWTAVSATTSDEDRCTPSVIESLIESSFVLRASLYPIQSILDEEAFDGFLLRTSIFQQLKRVTSSEMDDSNNELFHSLRIDVDFKNEYRDQMQTSSSLSSQPPLGLLMTATMITMIIARSFANHQLISGQKDPPQR